MTLADKIQAIRKAKGLSQMDMAEKLDVSQGTITSLERGRNKEIKLTIFRNLVLLMGVNPYYLLSDDPKEPMFSVGERQMRVRISKYDALIDKLAKLRAGNG